MKKLGDSHNFGSFVYEADGRVYKPRTLIWEKLILDSKSEFRLCIENAFKINRIASPFNLFEDVDIVIFNGKKFKKADFVASNFDIPDVVYIDENFIFKIKKNYTCLLILIFLSTFLKLEIIEYSIKQVRIKIKGAVYSFNAGGKLPVKYDEYA